MKDAVERQPARAPRRVEDVLTVGNAAKLYCLQMLEELAQERQALRIVDLGAGDCRNWPDFLRRHPHVTFVGVDPSAEACALARAVLPAERAEIVHARAYEARWGTADAVVSWSALEHVYRRRVYLETVAATLAPDGLAFVNYDAGHFRFPTRRDRVKNVAGPLLARLGREDWYQAFVSETEFRDLVTVSGLRVVEARSFNTAAKDVYHRVAPESRTEFMRAWLAFELAASDLVEPYADADSRLFRTRNFVLMRADDSFHMS